MRVCLDGFDYETARRLVFLGRVIPVMENLGVTFQYDTTNADVILVCNKNIFKYRKSSLPKAIRPVHIHVIDKPSTIASNKNRVRMCRDCDLVIWQCNWLRKKYRVLMDYKAKREVVIHNAASIATPEQPMKMDCKYNVIMLATWSVDGEPRPRKRLHEMVEVAWEYVHEQGDVCFWIVGENTGIKRQHDRIRALGKLSFAEVVPVLSACDAMLNLTWFDNCPNAVIEALALGIPVVCNNEAGTVELVRQDAGIIVNIDKPVTSYQHGRAAPKFDKRPVMDALIKVLSGWPEFERPDLRIDYAAQKYKEALEGLIHGTP